MIYLAIPAVIAVAVIAADWLDWHGTLGPAWWLTLPARLVMPHTGHHRDKYATDAPAARPPSQPAAAPQPAPAGGAAPLTRPVPSPGPGQRPPVTGEHPFDGHREPWYVTIGERTPPGRLLAVGYEPFDTGPRAVIPDPRVSLRRTGAHAAVEDGELVPVRPYAEQWWKDCDRAVNE